MAKNVEIFLLGLICLGTLLYLMIYVNNRRYLYEGFKPESSKPEGFQVKNHWGQPDPVPQWGEKGSGIQRGENGSGRTDESPQIVTASATVTLTPTNMPYDTERIDDLYDYETNYIYQNETDKPLTKELRNKLMSQYPMSWTGHPPSSSQFQAGLRESFENAKPNVPDDAKPYKMISGDNMAPPDMSALEREERKILQTYKPSFPPTGTTYDPRDAEKLIHKLYDVKGLVPQVKHKEGSNIYEIVGTWKKGEKVQYEDEVAPVSKNPVAAAGEGTIEAPFAVNDLMTSTKDSFYDASSGKKNMWDYTSWTPGLERMFAPTEPKVNWE
jgi:hypothetical protein